MNKVQVRAQKIFARCFTRAELESLQRNAEFNQVAENIQTLADAFVALELGERLTSEAQPHLSKGFFQSCGFFE